MNPHKCLDPRLFKLPQGSKLGPILGSGAQGVVHSVTFSSGEEYVLKLGMDGRSELETEAFLYRVLKRNGCPIGFPKALQYGSTGDQDYIVMTRVGETLHQRLWTRGLPSNLLPVIDFTIGGIERIQTLHGLGFLHRDIKTNNLAYGRKGTPEENMVHLIDFGLAKRYVNPHTDEHITVTVSDNNYTANLEYGSPEVNTGRTSTRKDDLISLLYCAVFCCKGRLPWSKLRSRMRRINPNENARTFARVQKQIMNMKMTIPLDQLFQGLPICFKSMYASLQILEPKAAPKYDEMLRVLRVERANYSTLCKQNEVVQRKPWYRK